MHGLRSWCARRGCLGLAAGSSDARAPEPADGVTVAKLYIRHGRFVLDFLSVLPFIYLASPWAVLRRAWEPQWAACSPCCSACACSSCSGPAGKPLQHLLLPVPAHTRLPGRWGPGAQVVILAGDFVRVPWIAIVSLIRLVRLTRLLSIASIILEDVQRVRRWLHAWRGPRVCACTCHVCAPAPRGTVSCACSPRPCASVLSPAPILGPTLCPAWQGEQNSTIKRLVGSSATAYILIAALFVTITLNLEACLLVLMANIEGLNNRCGRSAYRHGRHTAGWFAVPGYLRALHLTCMPMWDLLDMAAVRTARRTHHLGQGNPAARMSQEHGNRVRGCSWMAALDWVDVPNSSKFYQWYLAIYMAICSVSARYGARAALTALASLNLAGPTRAGARVKGEGTAAVLLTWLRCPLPLQNTSVGYMGTQLLHEAEFAVGIVMQVVGAVMYTFVITVSLTTLTKVGRGV